MALDPNYFALKTGLSTVWNNTAHLSLDHKNLITSAVPGTTATEPPYGEWQLDRLHGAISATDYLNSFERDGTAWVTPHAKQVPSAFKTYIHEVGMYFHGSGHQLPAQFVDPLATFIRQTGSHVATLNYDNLLYDTLIKKELLNGFSNLLDGFTGEFNEYNLVRYRPYQQSYYLHLHGSPLFIGNRKCGGAARALLGPEQNNHIILTHVTHKPYYISLSPILSTYWRYLDAALDETDRVFLIGYSGEDSHLNYLLRSKPNKKVVIVEWAGAGDIPSRLKGWMNIVGTNDCLLYHEQNIFNFNDWHLQLPVNIINFN